MDKQLQVAVEQLVGMECKVAENPYGSILSLDFGPLGRRVEDAPDAKLHGFRHLTVLAPWRVQDAGGVLFDWNSPGGADGELKSLIQIFVNEAIVSASTSPPAWDLNIRWESGCQLVVFGDFSDDEAWFILGTDGFEAVARPFTQHR